MLEPGGLVHNWWEKVTTEIIPFYQVLKIKKIQKTMEIFHVPLTNFMYYYKSIIGPLTDSTLGLLLWVFPTLTSYCSPWHQPGNSQVLRTRKRTLDHMVPPICVPRVVITFLTNAGTFIPFVLVLFLWILSPSFYTRPTSSPWSAPSPILQRWSQTSPIAFLLGFPRQQAWGIHGVEYTYLYFFKVNQLPWQPVVSFWTS